MGWDAYALRNAEEEVEIDLVLQILFWQANAELIRRTGISGQLIDGELGGSSLPFLIRATPLVCFDLSIEEGRICWPKEAVKEANDKAQWDYPIDDWFREFRGLPIGWNDGIDDGWDEYERWETRLFLETCAENGLAILFTW